MSSIDIIVILINVIMYNWTMYVLYTTTILKISNIKESIRNKEILEDFQHLVYIGTFFIVGFIIDLLSINNGQLPTITIGIVISCILIPLYLKYIRYGDKEKFSGVPYLEYCRVCFDIYYICVSYTIINISKFIKRLFKRK